MAYFISRLKSNEKELPIEDYFLNGNLFAVSTKFPWFVDIVNYLAIGKIPQFTFLQRRNKRSSNKFGDSHGSM